MAGWVLFETTESVIEILWDIALVVFIVRIGFIYFLLTFTSSLVLSYLAYAEALSIGHLMNRQPEFLLIFSNLALVILWARIIITYYEIPRVKGFRLAIGGTALAFMVMAEFLTAVILYGEGHGDWIFGADTDVGLAFGGLLAAFLLMPIILMAFESKAQEREETYHGHDKKSITEAVPTVSRTDKKSLNEKKTN